MVSFAEGGFSLLQLNAELFTRDLFECLGLLREAQGCAVLGFDGSIGWEDARSYEFEIDYSPTSIKIQVDGNTIFDIEGVFIQKRLDFIC